MTGAGERLPRQSQTALPDIMGIAGQRAGGRKTIPLRAKEEHMPYVNIRITKDGASAEKKAELIRGVTDLLVRILGKNPQTTVVTIDEIDSDNWGIGGESVRERRRKEQARASLDL
jgi:4-oxalocrotonate tautomerase